ncbi:hypothetical protein OAT67_09215 [Bacteriovoracaceae bacterium]|nr:hypothetical protein [Bacteriovoracaceae bacterium]
MINTQFKISKDDEQFLATYVAKICENIDIYDWSNGHACDRHLQRVDRITICKGKISEQNESVLGVHTFTKHDSNQEMSLEITKTGPQDVSLDFSIGFLNEENMRLLKQEILSLYKSSKQSSDRKKKLAAMTPAQRKNVKFSTKRWKGLYVYRGKINPSSRYWKNYEEALRLNIASPELIQSMKEWNLYFQDK